MEVVVVKKWGEKMNSPHPSRRSMYITIEPTAESVTKTLKNAADEMRMLVAQWYTDVPEWWIKHKECVQCKTRKVYENLKFVASEWVWCRKCMRHHLIEHLESISNESIESNRYIEFGVSKQQITFKIQTNNYDYDVTIFRTHAILTCNYKGSTYRFTYKNHTNALPYASTYFILLGAVCRFAIELQRFLAHLAYDASTWYNVYINGTLFLQAGEGGDQ